MAKADSQHQVKLADSEIVSLRSIGWDEKLVQQYLADNPEVLGRCMASDLEFVGKEIYEPRGGRLDLLFQDSKEGTRYCVELMLGALDESHFVRAIEYWDEERTKSSRYDHVAVMIAEEVAGRFSNLFALIAKTIPVVAFKVVAVRVEERVALQFIKVLDFTDHRTDQESISSVYEGVAKTREEWVKESSKEAIKAVDEFNGYVQSIVPDLVVTHNKHHIAIGTTAQNFAWHRPRKKEPYSYFEVLVGRDNIDEIKRELGKIGKTYKSTYKENKLIFELHTSDLKNHLATIQKIVSFALQTVGYDRQNAA
jgi:hypothetical protein